MPPGSVLVCLCGHYDFIDAALRDRLLGRLEAVGAPVVLVDDLCAAAVRGQSVLAEAAAAGRVRIAACHPRAVRWLFEFAGLEWPQDADVLNLRTADGDLVDCWPADLPAAGQAVAPREVRSDDDWPGWFPVIDYDLCTQCRKCLGFCLFDVYALDDAGRVVVKNPAKCKTNCPACARVCPQRAVIFPKYHAEPINGGPVDEQAEDSHRAKGDVTDLSSTDVYEALRRRSAGPAADRAPRFAPGKDSSEQDKAAHLRKLQQELDIPDEVLDSLRRDGKPPSGP